MPAYNVGEKNSGPEYALLGVVEGGARKRRFRLRRGWIALLLAALALAFLLRIPILYNSVTQFNSDEAVNALVIKHMLEGREFSFFNWDTTYYGISESLIALPFIALFGFVPLSFKLAALTGFLILLIAVFFLGRRLFGTTAGLAASASLAVFSPMLLMWSTLASGGYCLIVGWGAITVLQIYYLIRKPSIAKLALLGWLLGSGIYIYQLYFVYVVTFSAALALVMVRELSLREGRARAKLLFESFGAARIVKWLLAFAGAFTIGCAPKIIAYLSGVSSTKQPSFGLAAPAVIYGNLKLLLQRCLPAFFGVNPFGAPELARWSGPSFPLWAETFYLGLFMAAWLWGVWTVFRSGGQRGSIARRRRAVLTILVLLPVVNVLLFILSTNPQDTLSNRYLLPSLTSLTVLAGGMIVHAGRRSKACAILLTCAVLAFGLSKSFTWLVNQQFITSNLQLVRKHEPLLDVLDLLRKKGVRGAFGDYWTAYKATFLSREEILVTSIRIWDRNPELTRAVRALPTAAYIFHAPSRHDEAFRERLQDYNIPYERHIVNSYAVYLSPTGESLGRAELGPLSRFDSAITVEGVPPVLLANQLIRVKISVRNTSDSVWSAAGGDQGEYRVAASYRWLNGSDGQMLGDGDRALFSRDIRPGETEELLLNVKAPARAGSYILVFSLVQEWVAWFCDVGGGEVRVPVLVKSDPN
ncbi:MAG TPA: glycosyltransferase family 39 protein [Pyrinomonadaceae bacterium]